MRKYTTAKIFSLIPAKSTSYATVESNPVKNNIGIVRYLHS